MIIDISPIISEKIAVFPGDTAFSRRELLSFEKGNHLGLSSIETTVHLGAHTDAPNHYDAKGADIAQRDLEIYIGTCQVMSVNVGAGAVISEEMLKTKIQAPRVLFKTLTFPDPNQWTDDFAAVSAELIESLAQQGVKLIGIDTPSIDPATSKDLSAHKAIAKNDMAILEGIVLDHVSDGLYELIALPLRIAGADASPVRAVLRALKP